MDWHELGNLTKKLYAQHLYTVSLASIYLPNKSTKGMMQGYYALISIKSDLESLMFRMGGPQDIGVFYGGNEYHRPRPPQSYIKDRKSLPLEKYNEILDEINLCQSMFDQICDALKEDHDTPKSMNRYPKDLQKARMELTERFEKYGKPTSPTP